MPHSQLLLSHSICSSGARLGGASTHAETSSPPPHQSSNTSTVNGICNHPEAKHLGDKVGTFMLDLNSLNLIGLDLSGNYWHHQWARFLERPVALDESQYIQGAMPLQLQPLQSKPFTAHLVGCVLGPKPSEVYLHTVVLQVQRVN